MPSGIELCEKKPYLLVSFFAPAPSIGINFISTEEASSTKAPVGYPATTKIASNLPFLRASVAALPFNASAFKSFSLRPFASKIKSASTYVPEPGSSNDTFFPLRSLTEFILLFFQSN